MDIMCKELIIKLYGRKNMLNKEYIILIFFMLVNLALPFYRRAAICNVVIYILSFITLYTTFLFYSNMRDIAIIIYFISSLFISIRQNIYFIYVVFVNIFICYVVINATLYGYSIENFNMIFPPDVYENLNIVNMISDVANMALLSMLIGCIFFVVSKIIIFVASRILINEKNR